MIGRLLELFEGPEAPGPWSPPAMPVPLHSLLPWRAWDESSELYVNAASTGFVLELGRVASITGQARSTLTRENGQPTDSNLAQPSSVILLRARIPICASVF